jgi:hypothetical protein
VRINLNLMNVGIRSQSKNVHKKDVNIGVVIIFIIVTLFFLLSLTQSNYSKVLFSNKTEFRK